MAILYFFLILGILVFVHELGHFVMALRSGVAVEEFGFGFPPRLVGWKRGPTIYSLNWIPFGGFVRLQGEQHDQAGRPDSFIQAPFRRQFAILSAGVLMNLILAWLLITVTLIAGVNTDATTIPANHFVRRSPVRVEALVSDGTVAAQAGLRTGDQVLTINGQPLHSTDEVINLAATNHYPKFSLAVQRGQNLTTIDITPQASADHPRYGFGIQAVTTIHYPWYAAPWFGLGTTAQLIQETLAGLGRLIRDLVVTARVSPDVTGPVGIAVLTGQVVQYGFIATLQFMSVLSISLAVVNFLPLPALDGGRAVFTFIARLRGRPLNTRVEGTIHLIGFYALLLAIVLLSIRDVHRFQLIEQLKNLFR